MSGADPSLVNMRAMEPEDLDFLYDMENNRELWGVGNTNVPYSRYVLHDYIANASNDIYVDGQVRLVIENKMGKAVGVIDVVNFDPRHQRAEVSIAVAKEHRRHGYARAAVAKIKEYARQVLHVHMLYVVISEENEASVALFSNAGFALGGKLCGWLFDGSAYRDAVLLQCFLS